MNTDRLGNDAEGDALPDAPRLRVLYVEDNRINAILFAEALRQHGGVDLQLAEDSDEALTVVRAWTPDVLVLDSGLPGLNGFELLSALRCQAGLQNTPAFMCSADATPENLQRAVDAGFDGYWTKPIDIVEIMAELDRVAVCHRPSRA
jgi:CheY-like chemotaxis protein